MNKWQAKFEDFDAENPHVYSKIIQYAGQLYDAGRRRTAMNTLMHRVRWDAAVETNSDDRFKINENFTPYYARKLADDFPRLGSMLEFRRLRAE